MHYGNLILDLSPLSFAELQENGSGIESDERRTDEEFLSFVIDSGMYEVYVVYSASILHVLGAQQDARRMNDDGWTRPKLLIKYQTKLLLA